MELATLLNAAGVRTIPMQNARGAQWTKLIFNAAVNPIGALTRLSYRASIELPFTKQLCEALVSEGEAVAGALGIPLLCDPHDLIQEGLRTSGQHEVSMLQDVRTQALTEIDFINGMIADIGRRNGVPTPLHRTMHQLIKGLEESWERAGYQLQTQGFRAGESEM
jgi:2-dehydropantoate 2-reductase